MIIGIGGGEIEGWSFKTKDDNQSLYQTEKIDKEIVKSSNKENPKLLFIGTASRENPFYFKAIKNIYENLNCKVDNLELINKEINIKEIEEKILLSDIIYIGGGNTKFMLEKWKEFGIDKIIVEAYKKGILMAGFSAGCYAYFNLNYEMLEGLKLINGIICVHYDEKSDEKKNEFLENIKKTNLPGIALDNGTAIKYNENKTFEIIKSLDNANAYMIKYINNKFEKVKLEENIKYVI